MIERLSKIVLTAAIACFFTLAVVNNVTDYATNFAFVQHVLSMDTIFPTSTLSWRAITNPQIQHLVYWSIIVWETFTAAMSWIGVWRLSQHLKAKAANFNAAKSYVLLGLTASCLLWLVGFFCIAGEWFAMWQSSTWNEQPIAFRMFVMTGIVLLLVRQPDADL